MLRYEKELTITGEFLDKNQHVNNVQYVHWVEEMAAAHWEVLAPQTPYQAYVWFLVDHHIQYKKQAFAGDVLLLRTCPLPPEGLRQPRKVEFYKNGELIVDSRTLWVMVDPVTGKIVRLDPDWLEKLERKGT